MSKKVSSLVMLTVVAAMLLGLVGCGKKETPPPTVESPVVEQPEVIEEVEPEALPISMAEIVNTVKYQLGDRYLPNMLVEQDVFNQLVGLTSDMYEEYYAEMPMISTHVDRLFIVRTSNTAAVEDAFKTYHQNEVEGAMQYPMNLSKVENAVITTKGDYVFYYILGGYSDVQVEDDGSMTPEELDAKQMEIDKDWAVQCGEEVLNILDGLFTAGYDETIPDVYTEAMEAFNAQMELAENVESQNNENVESIEPADPTKGLVDETTEPTEPTESVEPVAEDVTPESTETVEPTVEPVESVEPTTESTDNFS